MIVKNIAQTAGLINGKLIGPDDINIHGVEIDSRKLQPGMLFIPLIGARSDGHQFLKQAEKSGAAAMLWQSDHPLPETELPLIVVEDTEEALRALAKGWLEEMDCRVIGITGSNGKTSTKDMFADVFSCRFKTHKTPGNRNNQIGLPLTILEMDADTQIAVLEMGMEGFHEIEQLVSIARPDIAVITSIGSAHLENLKSKKGIAQAKLEIADGLKEGGILLYDKESPEIEEVLSGKNLDESIKTVAFGPDTDVYLTGTVQADENGLNFVTSMSDEVFHVPSFGSFMPKNALPVIYAAKAFGIADEDIKKGLAKTDMTGMRLNLIPAGKGKILDDTYKSNPESVKAAIDTLMSLPAKKHIAVLSDMLDLGPDSQKLHEETGRYALEKGVDMLYACGPLSTDTAAGFGESAIYRTDKSELAELVRPWLDEDAIILVKGSRAMAMDSLVKDLQKIEE